MERTLDEICKVIYDMDDFLFEKLNYDYIEWAYTFTNSALRRNAKRRLNRDLKKAGLTLDEYELWSE